MQRPSIEARGQLPVGHRRGAEGGVVEAGQKATKVVVELVGPCQDRLYELTEVNSPARSIAPASTMVSGNRCPVTSDPAPRTRQPVRTPGLRADRAKRLGTASCRGRR